MQHKSHPLIQGTRSYLHTVHLSWESFSTPHFYTRAALFLKALPCNVWSLPRTWMSISRINLQTKRGIFIIICEIEIVIDQPRAISIQQVESQGWKQLKLVTHRKQRAFKAFNNFHFICNSIMSPRSSISNWMRITIFTLKQHKLNQLDVKHIWIKKTKNQLETSTTISHA